MTRRPCLVGVPMMDRHELTRKVVEDLDFDELDELVIFDMGSEDPASLEWLEEVELEEKVVVDRRGPIPEESLYRAWNDTARRALELFPDEPGVDVVILNNDVRLPPGFLGTLTRALRSGDPRVWIAYPDARRRVRDGIGRISLTPTRGLANDGGMTGWAFAVKAEAFRGPLPYIDERLRFYSGDRDLIRNVEIRGYYAARVKGLPIDHELGATRKRRPELLEAMRGDVELCRAKWKGAR